LGCLGEVDGEVRQRVEQCSVGGGGLVQVADLGEGAAAFGVELVAGLA